MRNYILIAALTLSASGCATPVTDKADSANQANGLRASALAAETGRRVDGIGDATQQVSTHAGVWLPTKVVNLTVPSTTPSDAATQLLQRKIDIAREFGSISEVAARVTALSGVPVDVAPDAQELATSSSGPAATQAVADQRLRVNYSGPMSGFFDMVAAHFNLNWKTEKGRVVFFRMATKVFTLNALPGDSSLKTLITTNSAAGSGSSNESSVNAQTLSVWSGMESTIKAMLSAQGKVVVSPALGTIAVTDTPEILGRVAKLVEDHNASLTRQVAVNVQVLSVNLENADEYGINWNAVYSSLAGNFGIKLSNAFLTTTGSPGISLSIPDTTSTKDFKRWVGSDALITALSTQGKVSVVTSASAVTLNNQPVPIQVGRKLTYLASSTTTATANVGSTTSLIPGTLNTGFSMTLLPHILDDGQVLLQYAMDISSLVKMYTVTSGDASIQVPDVETRNFLQRVSIRSGDTLVLAGFEQAENSADKSGAGKPTNTLLGGGVRGKDNKNIVVVLVRPVVIEGR